MKILVIGNSFIGNRCKSAWGNEAVMSTTHIESANDARREIEAYQPDAVLNAAGVTGRPNVDWCETHQIKTILGNTKLPIDIATACQETGIYLLHMGSGCIFYGDAPYADRAWREDDFGNPVAVYSRTKWAADLMLSTLTNVGIARIRMPIDHMPGERNLIDKLAGYPKVIDVENSVTIIDDMLSVFKQLIEKKATGIFHVTNPGTIKHRYILALYEELVDPSHRNEWINNDDLVQQGLASKERSNNFLKSDKLDTLGITMRPVKEALRDTLEKYAKARRGESVECEFC